MSLMDMIEKTAGSGALDQIAARVGLPAEQLRSVVGSLAPALAPKLAEHAATGGLDSLPGVTSPPAAGSDEADLHGKTVLGTILGSKDASRSVAGAASAETGVSVDKIKAVLPQLAGIAAAAFLAHRASQGGGLGDLGGLGGLLGGLGR